MDHLHRRTILFGETGPQYFMAEDNRIERSFQSTDIKFPLKPERIGDVVVCSGARQPIQKPQTLLWK